MFDDKEEIFNSSYHSRITNINIDISVIYLYWMQWKER